ncbi:MAG: hypothetical protein KC800_32495, partial [Candidatus Eremiobacteraeota bacterium]|nr:hypothetical protein [Candidatus Eremiobacteraeota bacterium]
MGLDQYLQEQASGGSLEAEGKQFTLDLSRAADKLAAFALPSSSHYLLKIVQVAHHLRAETVRIKIERYRTVVRFRAPNGGNITDSESIYRAFADPLAVKDPVMIDFISGLIGTITDQNLETLWSYSEGHKGRRVFINRQRRFSIEDFILSQPLDEDDHPYAFTLSVLHPRSWKFWQGARRRAEAARVLENNCRYSGVKLFIDARELELQPSSELNSHLKISRWVEGHYHYVFRPADNILYDMAAPEEMRCGILRPSLSAYVVRADHMNLWVSSIRVNNTLRPDGNSSAAWMLQFLEEGQNVSMRFAPKRVPVRACLCMNLLGEGAEMPLRVKIVRAGVTVLEQSMDEHAERFKLFTGCILLFNDEELETDLTGFQIIQNEAFFAKIDSYQPLVIKARQYFDKGKTMIQGHPLSE